MNGRLTTAAAVAGGYALGRAGQTKCALAVGSAVLLLGRRVDVGSLLAGVGRGLGRVTGRLDAVAEGRGLGRAGPAPDSDGEAARASEEVTADAPTPEDATAEEDGASGDGSGEWAAGPRQGAGSVEVGERG
ncbi:hypothetical protein [Streptomyces cacaoi]|uniref:hypothetical protein n=1 Tax=Streptomyces cacaoi TaxID=1898 RepID=UPI0011F1004E|nr:hypothetical protein [Streptomyces cacaoi]